MTPLLPLWADITIVLLDGIIAMMLIMLWRATRTIRKLNTVVKNLAAFNAALSQNIKLEGELRELRARKSFDA